MFYQERLNHVIKFTGSNPWVSLSDFKNLFDNQIKLRLVNSLFVIVLKISLSAYTK